MMDPLKNGQAYVDGTLHLVWQITLEMNYLKERKMGNTNHLVWPGDLEAMIQGLVYWRYNVDATLQNYPNRDTHSGRYM